MLRWAREHGCEWDEQTCALAAEGGHLDVLQWARAHGGAVQVDSIETRVAISDYDTFSALEAGL